MEQFKNYIIYKNDNFNYGLELNYVVRVIPSVYITPLSNVTERLLGVINMEGQIIPIINTREIFSLEQREQNISDKIIIIHTQQGEVGLLVDSVKGIIKIDRNEPNDEILNSFKVIEHVSKVDDDPLFIINPSNLLGTEKLCLPRNIIEDREDG